MTTFKTSVTAIAAALALSTTFAAPAQAVNTDYDVYFANVEMPWGTLSKGDVTFASDNSPLSVDDDACGRHFEDGWNYAWVSSLGSPIAGESGQMTADIDVYAPYPGCGGGSVEAFMDQMLLQKPETAVILRLYDVPGTYEIDSNGERFGGGGGGICLGGDCADDFAVEQRDEFEYELDIGELRTIKRILLVDSNSVRLPQLIVAAEKSLEALQSKAQRDSATRGELRQLDDAGRTREAALLDAAAQALEDGTRQYNAGNDDAAYVSFDIAVQRLEAARAQ